MDELDGIVDNARSRRSEDTRIKEIRGHWLGDWLIEMLGLHHLEYESLAEKIGHPRLYVNGIVVGRYSLSLEDFRLMCREGFGFDDDQCAAAERDVWWPLECVLNGWLGKKLTQLGPTVEEVVERAEGVGLSRRFVEGLLYRGIIPSFGQFVKFYTAMSETDPDENEKEVRREWCACWLTTQACRRGLTEGQLASMVGQSRGFISRILVGRQLPSAETLHVLCERMSIPAQEFVSVLLTLYPPRGSRRWAVTGSDVGDAKTNSVPAASVQFVLRGWPKRGIAVVLSAMEEKPEKTAKRFNLRPTVVQEIVAAATPLLTAQLSDAVNGLDVTAALANLGWNGNVAGGKKAPT